MLGWQIAFISLILIKNAVAAIRTITAGAADFQPNPQTEYTKRFIDACDGQTWFINENRAFDERLSTHARYQYQSRRPCGNQEYWFERSERHRTYIGCNSNNHQRVFSGGLFFYSISLVICATIFLCFLFSTVPSQSCYTKSRAFIFPISCSILMDCMVIINMRNHT